jgi:nitrate/nitrite-specific signal transduction histidine kinase
VLGLIVTFMKTTERKNKRLKLKSANLASPWSTAAELESVKPCMKACMHILSCTCEGKGLIKVSIELHRQSKIETIISLNIVWTVQSAWRPCLKQQPCQILDCFLGRL